MMMTLVLPLALPNGVIIMMHVRQIDEIDHYLDNLDNLDRSSRS